MIDVATLSVIRRWALREQLSIREIARRTGLSRNTIRKYLRVGEAEPHYAKRVSPSKLDPFSLKLAGWLKTEAGRSRKQRRTIKQMYVDLQALGYGGSYNRVAAFARLWHEQRLVAQQTTGRGTFVPLTFGPGGQHRHGVEHVTNAGCSGSLVEPPPGHSAGTDRKNCSHQAGKHQPARRVPLSC